MIINHKPNIGIEIQGKLLKWKESLESVRNKLSIPAREIKSYTPDHGFVVTDLYEAYSNHMFKLTFDPKKQFSEFELIQGEGVEVEGFKVFLAKDIKSVTEALNHDNLKLDILSESEVLIPSLKTLFSSHESGDYKKGEVSYIYCSNNVKHIKAEKP